MKICVDKPSNTRQNNKCWKPPTCYHGDSLLKHVEPIHYLQALRETAFTKECVHFCGVSQRVCPNSRPSQLSCLTLILQYMLFRATMGSNGCGHIIRSFKMRGENNKINSQDYLTTRANVSTNRLIFFSAKPQKYQIKHSIFRISQGSVQEPVRYWTLTSVPWYTGRLGPKQAKFKFRTSKPWATKRTTNSSTWFILWDPQCHDVLLMLCTFSGLSNIF